MDAAKVKKLQEYAAYLSKQAETKEAEGKGSEAIKDYLKLVDILLIFAREAKDHTSWLKYTKQAEAYQNKVRSIVAATSSSATPHPASTTTPSAPLTPKVEPATSIPTP